MMRNYEKKAKFQEDEEPEIVEVNNSDPQAKPEMIDEAELRKIQAKMEAE